MLERMKNRIRFALERMIMRGAHFRLLVIAALIGLVSVVAGTLALEIEGGFGGAEEAIWWAFLRMTDSGYLGDDEGLARRMISTAVTVAGTVLFMGALIAIMTQWLNQKIEDLGRGYAPIVENDHVLILGWTNRTAAIVRELLVSQGRVKRFLRRHGARRLRVVILAEQSGAQLTQELRERLGALWRPRQIILRWGTPLRIEHLRRVDYTHAAAILIPGADFAEGGIEAVDAQTIKTLLSMSRYSRMEELEELPLIVAELFDERKIPVARRSYQGRLEVLASDAFASRLFAQNVRHHGLSHVFDELLVSAEGNALYVRECAQLAGSKFGELGAAFPRAIPLGVARPHGKSFSPQLNPSADAVVEPGDRLVLLGSSYEESSPERDFESSPLSLPISAGKSAIPEGEQRVLILGWNHKVPALLQEFAGYVSESFAITVISLLPIAERLEQLARYGTEFGQVRVEHIVGDYTVLDELLRAEPATYDNILLMASERLDTGEEADARTIMGHLLLEEIFAEAESRPAVLVELMDAENLQLFHQRREEILVSPVILSHMLAQVALRPELRAVFDELFGPGGAEIFFCSATDYGTVDRDVKFGDLQVAAAARGEIALGVRIGNEREEAGGGVYLNPDRERIWRLAGKDELVVLTTYA